MTTHPTPHCPAHTASLHHRHGTARKVRRAVLETTDADLPKPQLQTSARDFGLTGSSRASSPPASDGIDNRTPPTHAKRVRAGTDGVAHSKALRTGAGGACTAASTRQGRHELAGRASMRSQRTGVPRAARARRL